MKIDQIKSCYIGPHISPEAFIAEHIFIYLLKGKMEGYDGHKSYTLLPGQYCIVRRNHLARYNKQRDEGVFEKIVVIFDEAFLKAYSKKHGVNNRSYVSDDVFIHLNKTDLIPQLFLQQENDSTRERLLSILLKANPGVENILFDFGTPSKIDLESYMNRNFRFNVAVQRFAYLTGRSLTAFKQDFKRVFNDTPGRWLVQKRLKEAYFLIDKQGQRPSDVYLEVGFEDLSHFSYAFKKLFGFPPTQLRK
ncbi:AraC family transcriptional regulator [Chitinophaga sancti]|uniref:helix-turn-helix domain-containing protein n=1 Tax=Chitinophaga sancti TaxID=1004 RepID=UPI002A75E415|nr:AraC family transcriptional regulator [Chitinophaga sancti]WPQ65995.1 AraC family transcriptional regulator [Chitinophaga sancti]